MLGKIFGAFAGKKTADNFSGVDGTMGAVLGAGAATIVKRFGPLGMLTALVGGYAFKKYMDKREREQADPYGMQAKANGTVNA